MGEDRADCLAFSLFLNVNNVTMYCGSSSFIIVVNDILRFALCCCVFILRVHSYTVACSVGIELISWKLRCIIGYFDYSLSTYVY